MAYQAQLLLVVGTFAPKAPLAGDSRPGRAPAAAPLVIVQVNKKKVT